MNFSERIRLLRKNLRLTQQQLADAMKVDRTTVGKWEQINTVPNQDILKELANYFKVSTDYLLGHIDSPFNIHPDVKINTNIKYEREKLGISQAKLGEELGYTQQAVGKWESGIAEPNSDTIKKLCEIFNCSSDYLMGRTDAPDVQLTQSEISQKDALAKELGHEIIKFFQNEGIDLLSKNEKDKRLALEAYQNLVILGRNKK